jgi:hypothetical protein
LPFNTPDERDSQTAIIIVFFAEGKTGHEETQSQVVATFDGEVLAPNSQ